MTRFAFAALLALLAAACDPNRPRFNTVSLAPLDRQQLYTKQEGSPRGIACLTVDDSGLGGFSFPDLEPDEAQIGYQSNDNQNLRPRCRRDRNWEHHARLLFDLGDLTFNRGGGPLVQATLSGVAGPLLGNSCAAAAQVRLAGVDVGFGVTPFDLPEEEVHQARLVEPLDIDGRLVPFRERALGQAEGDALGPRGSAPNFVYDLSDATVARLADRLAAETGLVDFWLDVTLIGPENPDWRDDRICLERLEDLRLNLIFRQTP